jgi:uncharacterized protein YqcC (DUF446 family)
MAGPVVDTPSALEFEREIMSRASEAELQGIAVDLGRKSEALQDLLSAGPSRLDGPALRQVLRWVFATRRKAEQILGLVGAKPLAAAIAGLLDEAAPVADRIDRFDAALARFDTAPARAAGPAWPLFDLPAELLHFTAPDRYWLWTRWLWDPGARTGALALVTTDDFDLGQGATRGAVYLSVGRALAFVDETGKAAGFTAAAPNLFGADVFLASVYAVSMYTLLRMRMSREFNRVVPALPDLVRRLLGVYYLPARQLVPEGLGQCP